MSAAGAPTINVTYNYSDPYLVANDLITATITIAGFENGQAMQGFIATLSTPWNVRTSDEVFFNIDSVPNPDFPGKFLFEDGVFAAPINNAALNAANGGAARYDTGLLGSFSNNPNPALLGSPADSDSDDNVGGFALFTDGSDDDFIYPVAWLSLNSNGIPVNQGQTFKVMRLTWHKGRCISVQFVLAMNTPSSDFPMSLDLCTVACPWDVTNDLNVNVADLLAVIEDWSTAEPDSDINGSGTVGIEDLLSVISHWGSCQIFFPLCWCN